MQYINIQHMNYLFVYLTELARVVSSVVNYQWWCKYGINCLECSKSDKHQITRYCFVTRMKKGFSGSSIEGTCRRGKIDNDPVSFKKCSLVSEKGSYPTDEHFFGLHLVFQCIIILFLVNRWIIQWRLDHAKWQPHHV